MTTTDHPGESRFTTRLPTGLRERVTEKALQAGHASLSALVVALLTGYDDGRFIPPVRGPEPRPVDEAALEIGRQIVEDGVTIHRAARDADIAWPTAKRYKALYLAHQAQS